MSLFGDIMGGVAGMVPGVGALMGGISAYGQSEAQKEANQINMQIANQATQTNIAEAQKNRDFQERMSNSAYQRSMEDMQKAGLNPMLAFSQGGASQPSGSTASAQTTSVQPVDSKAEVLRRALATAMEVKKFNKEMEAIDSQVALNKASETAKLADKELSASSAQKIKQDTEITKDQIPTILAEATSRKKGAEWDAYLAGHDAIQKRAGSWLDTAAGAFRNFFRGKPSTGGPTPGGYGPKGRYEGNKDYLHDNKTGRTYKVMERK